MLAQDIPGVRLIAACNPSTESLQWVRQDLGVEHLYQDFRSFLDHPGLDAVVLASPTTAHPEQFEAALLAGKHVFVEKPLSLDVATCEALCALAASRPRQVAMVGFERRFDPDFVRAHESMVRGELGRPFLVRSQTCDMNDPNGFFVRFSPRQRHIQ